MSTLVIGIRPDSRNVGVCVSVDDVPIEAVTLEGPVVIAPAQLGPDGRASPGNPVAIPDIDALTRLAWTAIDTAHAIYRDHAELIAELCGRRNPKPLWVIEQHQPPRRASAGRGRHLETVIAHSISQGAFAACLTGEHTIWIPTGNYDQFTDYPTQLRGAYPREWRGRRGSDRKQQRAAWAIGQAGLVTRAATLVGATAPVSTYVDTPTPSAPPTATAYAAALRGVVATTSCATVADLLVVSARALAVTPRPPGVPDITPAQVANHAIQSGLAPHLNTPDHLVELAAQAH